MQVAHVARPTRTLFRLERTDKRNVSQLLSGPLFSNKRALTSALRTSRHSESMATPSFAAVDELGGNVSSFVHAAGFFHEQLLSHRT